MLLLLLGSALAQLSQCKGGYDIYWVLDHSASVTTNFNQYMLPFAQTTTNLIATNTNVKTSLIWFGNDGHLVSPLTSNVQRIQQLLADPSQWTPAPSVWGEGTNTATGLEWVESQLDPVYNSIVFLVTDGCTNQPFQANTNATAKRLQQKGAEIYFIYVPSPSDQSRCPDFMYSIASTPVKDHYLQPCSVDSVWSNSLNCYSQLDTQDFIQALVTTSCLSVNSVAPTSFCAQVQVNVSVQGQGFLKTTDTGTFRCLFGNTPTDAAVQSDTELVCITPKLPPGTTSFQVTRNGVTYTRTNLFVTTQTCQPPPPPDVLRTNASLAVSVSGPTALTSQMGTFSALVSILNNGPVAVALPLSVVYTASGRSMQYANCSSTADYLSVGQKLTCAITVPLTPTDLATGITVVVTASVIAGASRPSYTVSLSAVGLIPTPSPTLSPITFSPSKAPTSRAPTLAPSKSPTRAPKTHSPTRSPSEAPSVAPTTRRPTHKPSRSPTRSPTTDRPTTNRPTTNRPTTDRPTRAPSAQIIQTLPPSAPSSAPTWPPSQSPSQSPSLSPSIAQTLNPSYSPSSPPSLSPSVAPSTAPTTPPSVAPSAAPSFAPSTSPSVSPTPSPSASPTPAPSTLPTDVLTQSPSAVPTAAPSASPTQNDLSSSGEGYNTSSTGSGEYNPSSSDVGSSSSSPQDRDFNITVSSSTGTATGTGIESSSSSGPNWINITNTTNTTIPTNITNPPTTDMRLASLDPLDPCQTNKLAPRCIPWWGWLIVALGVTAVCGAVALLIAHCLKASSAAAGVQPLPTPAPIPLAAGAVAPAPVAAGAAGDGPVVAFHYQ